MSNISLTGKQSVALRGEYFASCHASTVEYADDGSLVVACFGGTREGHDDVGISVFRRSRYTFERTAFIKVAEVPHFNPVLYKRRNGELLLWFKAGRTIPTWQTWRCISRDNGLTWSAPIPLNGMHGPVKNKPLRLKNGLLCAPYSTETATDWTVHGALSYDDGLTFVLGGSVGYIDKPQSDGRRSGVIQPSVWQDDSGIHMLMRSTWGRLWRADSADGLVWSRAYATSLPNNNSGIDLAQTSDGTLVLAMNPTSGDFTARTPLILMTSRDNGETWQELITLEDAPGEYSYPAVIARGNYVTVSYTYRRETVVLAELRV